MREISLNLVFILHQVINLFICGLCFLFPLTLFSLFLHVLYCLIIKRTLDLHSFLIVLKLLKEVIELKETILKVFLGDFSVAVKVKSEPALHHKELHIIVPLFDVLNDLRLILLKLLTDHLNHDGNIVGALIIENNNVLL